MRRKRLRSRRLRLGFARLSNSTTVAAGDTDEPRDRFSRSPVFVTTHWSVVIAAGRTDTTSAQYALTRLCQSYWYPLYAYVRRRGYSPEDAEDLTQEFFARFLAQNWVERADREKGRFRTFLLSAMSYFLSNEWDKARAQKRGAERPCCHWSLIRPNHAILASRRTM